MSTETTHHVRLAVHHDDRELALVLSVNNQTSLNLEIHQSLRFAFAGLDVTIIIDEETTSTGLKRKTLNLDSSDNTLIYTIGDDLDTFISLRVGDVEACDDLRETIKNVCEKFTSAMNKTLMVQSVERMAFFSASMMSTVLFTKEQLISNEASYQELIEDM